MAKDFDMAQSPYFDRETNHKENRGFVPGKGHPDIKKTWPNIPITPVTRPNPFLKKGE